MKQWRRVTGFILTAIVCLYFSSAFAEDVRVFFSPNGGCQDAVIYEINKAKERILVAMYAFTSRPIAQALVKAHKRGVKVLVIMDRKFAKRNRFSKAEYLKRKGIKVKLLSPPPGIRGRVGLMHHKFAVIDGKVVLTGSYNWTASAERLNYENLLVFYSKKVARIFEEEFKKLWRQ